MITTGDRSVYFNYRSFLLSFREKRGIRPRAHQRIILYLHRYVHILFPFVGDNRVEKVVFTAGESLVSGVTGRVWINNSQYFELNAAHSSLVLLLSIINEAIL